MLFQYLKRLALRQPQLVCLLQVILYFPDRFLIYLSAIHILKPLAKRKVVLAEGVKLNLAQLFIMRENDSEVADGLGYVAVAFHH